MTRTITKSSLAALAGLALLLSAGCTQKSGAPVASSALANRWAWTIGATGTLLCAPTQAQIDACAGMAAGATCSLTAPDGTTQIAGTCHETIDGAAVACAPNPPGPPQELVDACTGKAAGDACTVTEEDGDTRNGNCVTARDGTTLICGRDFTPPQAAIDACATLAAGDTCTMPAGGDGEHDEDGDTETESGICSNGPAGTGPLACTEADHVNPPATRACAGLAAGAACSIGHDGHGPSGTCVVPAAGGDAVCVPACSDLGGHFGDGDHGDGDHGDDDHDGDGGTGSGTGGGTGGGMGGHP